MSTHSLPVPTGDPQDSIRWDVAENVRRLCAVHLRAPSDTLDDGTRLSLVFTPDLTPAEEAIFRRLVRMAGLFRITPTEWAAVDDDIDNARAYLGLATPTLAQTAGMTKSLIRILRVLLRD